MRGQHFAVGVDVHARALRLLQKHFEVFEVVPRNQDARLVPYAKLDFRDLRIAVGLRIRRVQERHRLDAPFARLQRQRGQRLRVQRIVQKFRQRLLRERVDFRVFLAQSVRVLHVCGKPFQAVSNQFTQTANIFVFRAEHTHRPRFCPETVPRRRPSRRVGQAGLVRELRREIVARRKRFPHARRDDILVKIRVGDGRKKIQRHEMIDLGGDVLSLGAQSRRHRGKPLRGIHQKILHRGDLGLFPADAHHRAAFAARRLLALKAKHLVLHEKIPPSCFSLRFHYTEGNGRSL